MTTEEYANFTEEYIDPIIEDSTTTVFLKPNCSVYNPCGSYGHCRNTQDGEAICLCKFWWNGTYCDEMTSNGKQIIALGVIIFVLLIVFYGLQIFFKIRHRQKNPKKNKEKSVSKPMPNRKFSIVSIYEPPASRRIFEIIIFIGTILLAAGTLTAKWRILQPIHDEIVQKFLNNSQIFYTRHSLCNVIDSRTDFNVITFPVACFLIVIFSLMIKRVSFKRGKFCWGHIGVPIPLNFFGHWKRTFTAVVFAIFADELMDIANQVFSGNRSSGSSGIIIQYLRRIFRVLVIGVRRYPILAAIHIDTSFSLICGLLYTWLDFAITIMMTGLCRNDFYPTDKTYDQTTGNSRISRYLRYYGTGPKLIFIQLLMDIPLYLFLSYISVKLLMSTIKRIRHPRHRGRILNRDQKELLYSSLPHSIESRYVKNLLGMGESNESKNRFLKIFRFIYTWRDDYRFSARIVSIYAAILLLLYFISVQAMVRFPTRLIPLQDDLQKIADFIAPIILTQYPNLSPDEGKGKDFRLPDFALSYYLAIGLTLLITILQLLTMLASIRRNMLQAYRGDYSEIPPPKIASHVRYVSGNFRFAGTLIGYVILGFVILGFVTFILSLIVLSVLFFGGSRFTDAILKLLIPIFLFIFFKMYLNKILSRYVFLQHQLNVLSINNRRAFMIFLYFNIFLDAFLGMVTAIMRLLRSIIGGIFYMCRLDYSPLGRKLEMKDAGFSAYCSFIYVECAHRHPVLLCFMSHLLRAQLYGHSNSKRRLSKARHKWAIAVFLINNPKLAFFRKSHLRQQEDRAWHMALIENKNNNFSASSSTALKPYHSLDLRSLQPHERF